MVLERVGAWDPGVLRVVTAVKYVVDPELTLTASWAIDRSGIGNEDGSGNRDTRLCCLERSAGEACRKRGALMTELTSASRALSRDEQVSSVARLEVMETFLPRTSSMVRSSSCSHLEG